MFFNVVPVLKKWPNYLIIHVGTNVSTNYTSTEILDKLMKLKTLSTLQRPATLLRTDSNTGVFLCNFRSFRNIYLEEHLRTTASKHRSSFLEVFCRSCCSALINAVMKYNFSAAVVQSWRVLHGNLLKIALHHRYFSNNFTTVAEQPEAATRGVL